MAADGRATEIVVIGGGTAGVRLAQRLAANAVEPAPGPATAVTLLGEEPHAPYNRVLLGEVLAGRYGPDVISLPPAPGTVRRGVRAVRIDRAQRLVRCDDGSVVPYGRLVLATGSNPVLPALRGLRRSEQGGLPAGVHSFRTMDDCLALSAAVRPGTRAVVIGGGLLGVSAARALAERGAQVVLAQQGEYLMERQLDRTGSLLLRRHLESWGVEVHTECRVRGLVLDDAGEGDLASDPGPGPGRLAAVELADGFRLDAELTVLACGVRPRTGLARDAGLDVRRGIVVDDELRTSDPYIHAIGDCAEHADRLYGLAGAAIEQADALARSLTAGRAEDRAEDRAARYTGTRALTRLTLAALGGPTPQVPPTERPSGPLDLAAFGETTPLPGDDVVQLTDATRGAYRKVVVRGDRLVGGVLLGDLTTIGALARTWEDDEPLPPTTPLLHLLTPDGGF
ncbi:FAD-dependent oxidoreductase [Streptomyces sp. IB2014 016-6]|uniref:NAD(P)/FAD-dependent oxidoreductase n=1 Tax=Streptomyces sp. IB2014 016-6 TaxID=2517818 RepID=UPI0011CB5862|nr:FAD-dependent oxidoreductase [Streptomyces sp. IB2014 016-6]TXL92435.1 NAD(P)/FAD-dependent oxidoreductase [Streptomyces sp. IB2014 016-6]